MNKEMTFDDWLDMHYSAEIHFKRPRIFMSGGNWVAVSHMYRTEYSRCFAPIAEAPTFQELVKKLKPSLWQRLKALF